MMNRVTLLDSPSGVTEVEVDVVAEAVPVFIWHGPHKREWFHLDGTTLDADHHPVYQYVGTDTSDGFALPGYPGA